LKVKTENLHQFLSLLDQKMIISLHSNKLGLSIRGSEILQKWLWLESRVIDCDCNNPCSWERLLFVKDDFALANRVQEQRFRWSWDVPVPARVARHGYQFGEFVPRLGISAMFGEKFRELSHLGIF